MNLHALHQKEFALLEVLDEVCNKHHLSYSLAWGSALGAVRHQGFIPWDDDIDIMMPWDDYMKFFEIMYREKPENVYAENNFGMEVTSVFQGRIGFLDTTNMSEHDNGCLTNAGICIDIFPLFPLSSVERLNEQKKHYNKACVYAIKAYHHEKSGNKKTDLIRCVLRCLPKKLLNNLARKEIDAMLQHQEVAKYYVDHSDGGFVFDINLFKSYIDISFENRTFKIIEGYDLYLQQVFDDYMTLPDEADRIQHITGQIIDTTKGFADYRKAKV